MKIWIIAIFVFAVSPARGSDWELIWADEFNNDGLPDPAKWTHEEGYIRNDEVQYYTKARLENARVADGMLVITTRNDNFQDHPITSASIYTQGKAEWLYGRIEVRAKLPTGKGIWPAIWMLGANNKKTTGWPDCGEIDIMENVSFDPHIIYGGVHTKSYNHRIGTNRMGKTAMDSPYKDFHIYSIEWLEDRVDFFVDDTKYFTFTNERTGNDAWPFDKPMYLILNAAYGGSWGGREGVDDTILPQQFFIDYVRVYKR